MERYERRKIGQVLLEQGLITSAQLDAALAEKIECGVKLGEILVRQLAVTETQVAFALAEREGLTYVDLSETAIDPGAVSLIPDRAAQRHNMLPIAFRDGKLVLAMSDPLDVEAIDDAELYSHMKVEPVAAAHSDVRYAIEKFVFGEGAIDEMPSADIAELPGEGLISEDALRDVPIVRVVNQLLRGAINERASDVHFEPGEKSVLVRYRIDGVLVDVAELPKASQPTLVSRLKLMANMDIAEHRRPQDGRLVLRVDGRVVDLRAALLPTPRGESIVLRVLDGHGHGIGLDGLGLSPENSAHLERMIARPYGGIFIAGPTGSGKTTTLYALLSRLDERSRKIITIEDPIEYLLGGPTQVAVNLRANVTFAAGLREILRFDPDIVMIGEVRDPETAAIAVRASLAGHLVLSSIHTSDAPAAITRLSEMGVEPYASSSALLGAVSQRLLRVLCPLCKKPVELTPEQLAGAGFTEAHIDRVNAFEPVGCPQCHGTGYRGRVAAFEIMEMNDDLRALVLRHASTGELRAAALESGMRSLKDDALDKVAAGTTSLAEVARAVG
jgi:type IV pilus assembly protein PilB